MRLPEITGSLKVGRVCPQRAAAPYERPTGALRTDPPYQPLQKFGPEPP